MGIAPSHANAINIVDSFKAAEVARTRKTADYHIPDWLGTSYVALTILILAFSNQMPMLPVLLFYAMWLPLPLIQGVGMLWPSRSMLWAASFSLLAVLSTLWSDYPSHTLYLGVALLSTIACVIILNQTVRFIAFARGIVLGIALAMVITLQSSIHGADALSSSDALVGYFGSKNAVGGLASFGMIACASLFFLEKNLLRKLILCVLPFALCAMCLSLSKSATSLLAVIVSLTTMLWASLLCRLPRRMKRVAIGATMFIVVVVATGIAMDGGKRVLTMLGKDATLSGRTYLWNEGYKIGWERPILGHGYSAFWVKGQPQAERYWYEFDIPYRDGFHFHSTYIQTFVDLGMVGALLVTLQLLVACWSATALALRGQFPVQATLLMGFSLLFFIRSFAEIDITSVFSISAVLFYSIHLRVAQFKPTDAAVTHG